MPYPNMEAAHVAKFPTIIDGALLSLAQVNALARMYDAIKEGGGADEPMAVAISQFKAKHVKTGDGWREKTTESTQIKSGRFYEACDAGEVRVLEEATQDGVKVPRLLVTVLREGFSKNIYRPQDPAWTSRRHRHHVYYTPKAVADVAEAINGKPAYVGDPTAHGAPRTLKDSVAGVFENGRVEEAAGRKVARAEIAVYPDQIWVVDRARINPRAFGPSIEADGDVRKGMKEGRAAAIVESVTELDGALLVLNPAAGGALDRILESQQPRSKRGGKKMFNDLTEAERAEVLAEARKLVESEADFKAKDAKIKELEEANKKLVDEQKAVAGKLAEAKSRELLDAAFPKDMPEVSKARLYESCKGETDAAKITEAVKKEVDYVAAVTGGVQVKGAPGRTDDVTEKGSLTEAENLAKEALGLTPPSDKKEMNK